MREAYIVIDIGFGDSGKGSIVDFLCESKKPAGVVRFSGGAQASHTVVRNSTVHRFHTYGSGTLLGVPTTLTADVLVDPLAIWEETKELRALGVSNPQSMLAIDPECLVVTPYHRALNRLEELARGSDVHGSCGMGIGVTRRMSLDPNAPCLRVKDFRTREYRDKIHEIRNHCSLKGIRHLSTVLKLAIEKADTEYSALIRRTASVMTDLDELSAILHVFPAILGRHPVAHTSLVTSDAPIVFEGSQGILIDQDHGFHPYTTWSDVTSKPAKIWARNLGCDSVTTVGVTRTYMARHGAGPLPSETRMPSEVEDPNNPPNHWQGSMRYGHLDLPLLRQSLEADPMDILALTCLDHIRGRDTVVVTDRDHPQEVRYLFGDHQALRAYGQSLAKCPTKSQKVGYYDLIEFVGEHLNTPVGIGSWGPGAIDKRWRQ